jgi:hypothetical protein
MHMMLAGDWMMNLAVQVPKLLAGNVSVLVYSGEVNNIHIYIYLYKQLKKINVNIFVDIDIQSQRK